MVWNRIIAALGASLAVLAALLLVLWGGALVRAFGALAAPLPDLPRELNLTQLAAMGVSLGLCLMVYGLGDARRTFHVDWLTKSSVTAGGAMTALCGGMVFAAFSWLQTEAGAVLADAAADNQHQAMLRVVSGGLQRMTAAYFTLFSAFILLAIGVWKLFWTDSREPDPRRSTFWTSTLTLGILCAATYGLMYYLAASKGRAAWELTALAAPPPLDLAKYLASLLSYAMTGAICLIMCGLSLVAVGVGLKTGKRDDDTAVE